MKEAKLDFCMEFEPEENIDLPPAPEEKIEEEPKKRLGFLKNPFKYKPTRNTVKEPPSLNFLNTLKAQSEVSKQDSSFSGTVSAK